jgi:capsular exopolysaccharide synthesis family protein
MAITTSTDRLIELQNEVEALESLITDWENNYTQLLFFLESKQSPTTLTIIEPAQANSIPVRPRIRLYMLIAGGVGLFLALGLIFLLEYLDDSIKSIDEFQQGFGTLILGTIPKIKGLDYENKLAVFQDHMSSTSEVFRLIGGNLQLYAAENAQKTIMITSPNQSEGKSLIIASLGTVLAQSGLDTIIVDANLRRPVVHEIFKIENKKGLMDLLSIEKFNIDDYLQDTQLDNLKLLTIGLSELNPSGLLKQQKVNQIIYALKKQADVVLFDSSSALDHADSRFLSTQMDGVILVAASNRTKNDQVKRSIQNLELSNANISGVIFNNYLPGKITRLFTKIRTFIRDREYRKRTDQDVGFVNKKDNFPKNQSEAPQESVPS